MANGKSKIQQAFLQNLPDLIPEATEIDEIVIAADNTASVSGYVKSNVSIANLRANFVENGMLENIEIALRPEPPFHFFRITGKLTSMN